MELLSRRHPQRSHAGFLLLRGAITINGEENSRVSNKKWILKRVVGAAYPTTVNHNSRRAHKSPEHFGGNQSSGRWLCLRW